MQACLLPASKVGGGIMEKTEKPKTKRRKTNQQTVWFTFNAPNAKEVRIAGDFSEWEVSAKALSQKSDGIWEIGISLPPGIYEYKFLVDGEWCNDPRCEESVTNSFGSRNNVLEIV